MLYVSFKIKKKFRKASSASVLANSSEHRILLALKLIAARFHEILRSIS
jgi:hypothetical protein